MIRPLELLAPAKDLSCGIAAVDHGADAIYIGASRFGARQAAGNSVDDIRELCRYAHPYGVKVYVTVNTIIYDDELTDTMRLLEALEEAGVDGLLIQDMGVLELLGQHPLNLPLHASTQCDSRSIEKVRWLRSLGFKRVVLARELSLEEIRAIHAAVPDVELEVFVHGALCVSYSGVCYASQQCFQRSANRGACAQFCRMKFDLVDSKGREIMHQRHLLSLRDMSLIDRLSDLADAGACSFKIEGRLKDQDYVKNVVSAYSERLNQLVALHPDRYRRASWGRVERSFSPDLHKTFNRGYTHYFIDGRRPDIVSFDTPKALGEYVGKVKELRGNSFTVSGIAAFANGDGLCFLNEKHELEGFRINRAEGNRLFPLKMPAHLKAGMGLYRNNDEAFSKQLSGQTAVRKVAIEMTLRAVPNGFTLTCKSPDTGKEVTSTLCFGHQQAEKPQRDNIVRQLTKLGNTPFTSSDVQTEGGAETFFIPSSKLADLRRDAIGQLQESLSKPYRGLECKPRAEGQTVEAWQREYAEYPYLYNISNHLARTFYERHGLKAPQEAFELRSVSSPLIMQCRHCLRYALGYCVLRGGRKPDWTEPLYLRLGDGRRFRLDFRCGECQMNIYAETDSSTNRKQ